MPGKSHGRRSLVGCSPWGCEELDTTEQLHFHFSLSSIGEGNGNPLQCSFQENSKDRGAWWAAIYGVAQSRTQLKWLSSSSSSSSIPLQRCTTWSSFSCQWISWLNLLQWKGKKEEWGFFFFFSFLGTKKMKKQWAGLKVPSFFLL